MIRATMKRATDVFSPGTMLVLSITGTVTLYVFFNPSLTALLAFLVLETLMVPVVKWIYQQIIMKRFPMLQYVDPRIDLEAIKAFTSVQRQEFYRQFRLLPRTQVWISTGISAIKVLPSTLLVIFYWNPNFSLWESGVRALGVMGITFSYAIGTVMLDAHHFLSRTIEGLHEQLDWSDVFSAEWLDDRDVTLVYELVSIVAIWAFAIVLQLYLNEFGQTPAERRSLENFVISLSAFIMTLWLWAQSRYQLTDRLLAIARFFRNQGLFQQQIALPLHTMPVLANLESSFNRLMARIRQDRQEINHWALKHSERKRYEELGEISGLVLHDLSSPLHVINFCSQELRPDMSVERQQRFLEQIRANCRTSIELVENIRSYIRNPNSGSGPCSASLTTAIRTAHRIIGYQFAPEEFGAVAFSDNAEEAQLAIPQTELNQVFINLFSNSMKNFIEARISRPSISVRTQAGTEAMSIFVCDNGSGMSRERLFHSISPVLEDLGTPQGGIGLRLVARVIDHYRGRIELIEGGPGTTLRLELPLFSETCKDP